MRLLIVEDDPLIGPAMKAVLQNAGHEVIGPLKNAAKAVRLAGRERPDLALIDYNLAGGENGASLARTLKEQHGIPSLMVTGYEHRGDEARDVALGCLRKPFRPEALTGAVTTAEELQSGLRPTDVPPALQLFKTAA
ncbi:response regulator [Azospirillum sp. SYSU D00513]|uniref:response regulator n=1 Tax=Azospirillum sp. SYSU D00513 TaxID=2812561 RepID=UPI001A9693E2